jgi:TATA-box binding protein (TBP) (component of TFIID and TFIIIB)
MLNNIHILENNSLKKHGRQKEKKDNEYFYNSCSIITKASSDIKSVNIKLFNNGRITLTGAKSETDGYYACIVLLEEMKKEKSIFVDLIKDETEENNIIFNELKIVNYKITMINSDFDTNFKIDLIKLLNILNTNEKELFTKFNPEKYRGLIIGFFWNTDKKIQDGKCLCKSKCNGKGCGTGDGKCKKITIAIFKSGCIIITGSNLIKQTEDAYKSINNIFNKYYHDIIKLSILDFIDEEELNKDNDYILDSNIIEKKENIVNEKKIIKIKVKKIK